MSELSIEERFEKLSQPTDFSKVENKLSKKRDLHAFLLLEKIFPENNGTDVIEYGMHEIIYLCYNTEQLSRLTDEQIIELSLCGFFIDQESLAKYT